MTFDDNGKHFLLLIYSQCESKNLSVRLNTPTVYQKFSSLKIKLGSQLAWPSTILQKHNIMILWAISHENVRKTQDGAIKT